MTEKDMTLEDLEDTMKQTEDLDHQLDLMSLQIDSGPQQGNDPVLTLLQNVHQARSDYNELRRELREVQALQRELTSRLRTQLRYVHLTFARLRERLEHAESR